MERTVRHEHYMPPVRKLTGANSLVFLTEKERLPCTSRLGKSRADEGVPSRAGVLLDGSEYLRAFPLLSPGPLAGVIDPLLLFLGSVLSLSFPQRTE